ncbi:hypothetical protein [Microcoleus sp. S28C3]|uniref:hypothetical protein n=1 Tax=Microcoleus sp. S28C3 TaxID=3055414 RepID=UPI002FD59547
MATLPDVRPTLNPQTLPVMQLCQPCYCHRWNIPKPARPRQMVHFVALLVVSSRSPRVDQTVLPSLLIQ